MLLSSDWAGPELSGNYSSVLNAFPSYLVMCQQTAPFATLEKGRGAITFFHSTLHLLLSPPIPFQIREMEEGDDCRGE